MSNPWKKADVHCPKCGGCNVYFRDDGGDYYEGELHICVDCPEGFSLQMGKNFQLYAYLWELAGMPSEIVFPPQPRTPLTESLVRYYQGKCLEMFNAQQVHSRFLEGKTIVWNLYSVEKEKR